MKVQRRRCTRAGRLLLHSVNYVASVTLRRRSVHRRRTLSTVRLPSVTVAVFLCFYSTALYVIIISVAVDTLRYS